MNTCLIRDALLPLWHKYATGGDFYSPALRSGLKNPKFSKRSQKKIRLNRRRAGGGRKHA